jgi:hypothetical protein
MTIETVETINLILFFASVGLLGAIRFFEGWKNFFKAFGLWIMALGIVGMVMTNASNDNTVKIIGMVVYIIINLIFGGYLFKKGYLEKFSIGR